MTMRRPTHLSLTGLWPKTANGSGANVEVGEYDELLVTLNCTSVSGTTPTLNVSLQISDDSGNTWYYLPNAVFPQMTAAGKQVIQVAAPFGDYIHVVWTVTGTSPSFTFAVNAVAKA